MKLDSIADQLSEGVGQLSGYRAPDAWGIRDAAYRLLSKGEPVALRDIAAAANRDIAEVKRCLQGSSDVTDGYVEAAMGLTLRPTKHRLRINGVDLYTWCALDLLFIPPTLDATAEIESTSPSSGDTIRAVVTPRGIDQVDPAQAVVSVVPIGGGDEIREAFCHFVHFFSSEDDAKGWEGEHPEGWVLPAQEAFELGIRFVSRLGGHCCE